MVAGCWPNDNSYIYKDALGCDRVVEVPNGRDGDEWYWDIDGFRAYKGCITSWKKDGVTQTPINRTGNVSAWIKISSDNNVVITGITCG